MERTLETNTLNTLVSGAIWRAEQLDDIRPSSSAWADVASFEEELAKALPVSDPQGRIARRGAVSASLKAADFTRAHSLAERYLAEPSAPATFQAELRKILEDDA